MKLLYIASVDFFERPNPSFHLMTSMISDLISDGNIVYFVGLEKDGVEKHIPQEFVDNPSFIYTLIKTKNVSKSNFVKRYIDGIKYAKKVGGAIKEYLELVDLIFIQSSPTVFHTISVVRRLTSKKIVYNVQDMFPGSSIASGVLKSKILASIFYRIQKKAYSKSDIIVAISDDMRSKLVEQGVNKEKVKVIVNWFDDQSVKEIKREDNLFIKKYNLADDIFYVQYAGTMGYVFDYKMVLNVAEKLKIYDDIVFQMIGIGSQKEDFIREAKERDLTNVVFLPLEPQNMVSHVYSACSVCIIPLKKGIIGNSVPSKAGLLMACKRPIITTADEGSDYNAMINNNNVGYAFSCDEAEKVANSILYLKSNPEKARELGVNGYQYGSVLYSRTENTKKYIELFGECI